VWQQPFNLTDLNLHIQGCIFDLDGVLVDTARYHFIAWRRLANELGFDFDEQRNEQLKGVGRMESLDLILSWGGVALPPEKKRELAARKNEWYVELIRHMQPEEVLPGVRPFLEELKSREVKIALGSASKNAPTILRQVGLEPLFDAVVDGNHTTRSKPDPEVFLLGAQRLGLLPERCIVFEDAEKGIQAARAGGFWAVGIGQPESLGRAHLVLPGFEGLHFEELLHRLARSVTV